MFKMFVFLISIISLLDLSVAQFVQSGQCDPNIQLVSNFDVTSFLGTWYVTKRFPNPIQNGDCSTLEFAEESGNLTIYNRAVQNNFLDEIKGTASLENGTAKFTITINNTSEPLDFWILPSATYASNSLGYSCKNVDASTRNVYIWQLSRTTTIGDLIEANMNQTLVSLLGITIDRLLSVSHSPSACHVLPDIPPGQPVVLPGQCNQNISVVQQFNVSAFTGVWHEISTYSSSNEIGTCRRAQYQLSGSGVEVINSEVVTQTLRIIRGNAVVASTDGSAKLNVTLNVGNLVSRPLWVLDTDYTSYAVSYTCENLANNQKRVNSWILSRSKTLTEAAQNAVNAVIRSEIDLNNRFYVKTDQTDDGCFYLPDFVPNQPVIFPGQCDLNIKGMGNFNVARYLGLWHNIESYFATSQRGTCLNARYSLGGDVVNVYNTQVVNQQLDTITGTASIYSTDGSAVLSVSFPGVSGTPNRANYYVLDSDYDSYAIVYSCSNINSEERRVTGFKLSRSRQLSNSSLVAIEKVINEIPVLNEKYFAKIAQTEEDCFYYPEPQPGVPVVFPGKCEDNINVIQNFSLEEFAGVWHEIEAYPVKQERRNCVNHNLTSSSNTTFRVETSSINDQFLEAFTSTGTLTSTDGSAKMTIKLGIENNQDIPFWILDTDYYNYALAYGCVNMPDDFRLIYSWKLSRNKQLSESNKTAIVDKMKSVAVLENRYFEEIKQSNEGCFYLPEIPKGDPIILNGQCDSNISVVPNFNAAAYLGNWRLIESYASQFQSGTCDRANYSLGDNNTVVVTNSNVVNQTLNTAVGSATILSNGKLLVNFPGAPRPLEYWILDTDYTTYSLVYSCENIDTSRRRIWSWKLSRSRDLTSNAIEKINHIIDSIDVLNNRYYDILDQSDDGCFYYPTPDPTKSVIFPGQCDPNIRVVTNFDAAKYMNLWHNIASYPTQFQTGSCGNALYTLQNGTVNVFNTQVINQRLDTINGVARLATTDGSAKLIVNFPTPSGGLTESPYWVLDTDYTSYALVYSCRNIDDESRQVTAWTLSRTKEMTANATAAINKVISTVPVLDNKYFIPRNQSAESCFYYPDPKPGVVVEFPGQCANTQAVQNFNMSLFQGVWHEIEAYPKEQKIGQCINHDYSLNTANSLNLVSSNVNAQELVITRSTVTFASAQDSSGNLIITLISGGQEIRIPFVVLRTDYTSYALAYSCVNLPNDFRRVFSWKLSRSKLLTSDANIAINSAIANIDVLDNRYYENIKQTDDACFYLPTPVPGVPVEFLGQCDENIAVVRDFNAVAIPKGEPIILNGQCDSNISVVPNFNAAAYLGNWRLIESYASQFQSGTCDRANYSLGDNNTVVVTNSNVVNQTLNTAVGSATILSNGKLLVNFPGAPRPLEYWILDTDYTTYSLVYSCENIDTSRRRIWSWKLSRSRNLTSNAIEKINHIIDSIDVLNNRYYDILDQSDDGCFYYPTPDPTKSVIFPGQCDPNIRVVTNFDAAKYMNLWHNIASYPTQFQTGSCGNALYTLQNGTVNVFNTQVINQRLDTINGVARLATTDGSAKLIVNFPTPSGGLTESPYWVLDTDYTSYALVYSCRNIDDESRQVTAWTLSRTKEMTANATAAINKVISTVPVLDNKYFIPRNQSAESCFYYPDPKPGVVVEFPGQCANIQAVQNFNMSLFQGVWHEIEAYPKEQKIGQCINHDYSLNTANSLNLVSSNVNAQELVITRSTVTFASAQDSSGNLIITLISGGQEIRIPFVVLRTDYTSYALAYSCVNLPNDFRRVFSWKLSRSKLLTSDANIAINSAIANIDVLDNRYYENIKQTDDACFYLPTPVPGVPVEFLGQCDENIAVVRDFNAVAIPKGEPIILNGQCNSNISVVPNFNAAAYLGNWRLIESYASQFQSGTCDRANYSLGDNNTVVVTNSNVVNQTLNTAVGSATILSNGKLLVNFPGAPRPLEYWILDTDYTTYSLVYSCENIDTSRRRIWSWKLSRSRNLTSNAIEKINHIIDSIDVLNNRYYNILDQSDDGCFYYPTPDPTKSVIFPGQCDPNIRVVTNFDAAKYMNLWHNIASYPTQFQTGSCGNALYTLQNGTVDVFNTQVINQRLDTINGVARLATTDGSAKLIVNFPTPSGGLTESPYWVLDTDYTSYALVYSCRNIDDESRQVTAWTLSRTKEMTANATAAINKVISTVPVLDNKYFIPRNQSAESCFYYPDPKPGVVVEFPGQCANIQAVQNFNMSLFQGVWHEIEAYPKEQKIGQCINHDYSLNTANSLNLVSSNVNAQELVITRSTVTFASAQDSSGNLIITLISGGQEIRIPFVVLRTDYTSYALAYSCVNLPNDFRRVFSWKLSRSKLLTSDANIAINSAIANIDVLDNRYYENIKQTDDACFYLPTPVPGVPVEFLGQCDENIAVVRDFNAVAIPKGEPIILNGQCISNISVVPNFNAAAYLGNWRLIESYASQFQSGTCDRANYSLGDNNTVVVTNSNVVNQTLNTAVGSATILSNGKLLVNFPGAPRPLEYWILDTDYTTYSLVYSCENIDTSRRRIWSWKLSRSRSLTSNAIEKINHIIDSIDVLNNRYYDILDQSDDGCFYYPTPDPTKSVIFPGQCDPNIRVVTNFDAAKYMNLWHNIASYPTQFQTGSCGNALYTLQNGTVNVFNTQVINQRLDTINGVARLATTDGSAKLIVNFPTPSGGLTESPYWVLDTDYTSYALVYSCRNIDDESRQVTAWTLSRTKEMTANATAAIYKVISTVPVLDNKYFIPRNQSAESCFYYPDPKPGVVVEFPGQCANIQAVQNFNMSLFQGVWHEIEAYPKEQKIGQCINHDYSLNTANSLNLVSSNVNAQELVITRSTVTFASAQDSSGNLIITLISGGQEIRIPFVVLRTDYTSYALAYSCVNLPNDFRRVFSWKLSRSKLLTSDANIAINSAIANIDVLDNRYYENIKQTDDACFYLPTPVPGVPVEFLGQCDENIAVVRDFNAVAYMGRWLLLESYPAPRQEGSCNDATYTLNGTTVDVYNTKVVNQLLETTSGVAVLATNDGSAKLLVTFPETGNTAPYWILDTDYTSFALVYSCQNLPNNRRRVTSWKLSRTPELTPAAITRINQVMSQVNVLDNKYFEPISRTDASCFYYPPPGPQSPVFRGRCNDNITVVQNFNAAAYLGTWYDIESYPVRFQFGSCPTATYEASDVGVNVYNTEVVAQRLSSVRGSAVLASTDGSAKLTVSFPIAGTNATTSTPYWVLATDYNNYALVYSCTNIDSEYKRVSGWKLSRTKTLTPGSTNLINNAMSSIPELEQRYFVNRGHTDENCFFYPDNNGGPVIQNGQCENNLNIVNNFDIDAFAGAWFEISRFPSELQNGECVSNTFTVNNQSFQLSKTIIYNDKLTTVVGSATLPQDGRGIITVNLSDGAGATFATTFRVLDVVYNDFALLHNCRNLNSTHKQIYSWKLSRSQTGLSASAVARINEVVDKTAELFGDYYKTTDQTAKGCFHYPVYNELPSSIELIGPCNTTIRAKSNFNVNAYLGKWYEIASYPQAFQNGECARAQYSAGNNVVNVLNTQVVNRTLDAQTATAVVASNDGSGLLEVTFSFGNVVNVVNYYVLETDYTSFSLVYSCQNLNNGNRRVSSWKLSRGKVLPSHAGPIIDNIIDNTQGLIQDYYVPTSQSDEDCFYIPQVNKNEAPLFRGQCEVTTGMQGFDVQKYLGWWHEIESYPISSDVGACISSNIRAVDNQYQITDTNVFNNAAQVNTSNALLSADGRIRKTLNNGVVVDIWVLETDYETYSLLYSCENVNTDYKRVWSAKHSKSRQLTAAAQQAMGPIIAKTETLEPQFYIPIQQTDEVCFHYPEQTGKQIIIPGQCDPNIPVVENFEPARYTGTWYQIEKYPQIFENGTCIGARYTLDTNTGVVDVLNWQVWNGTLDTIEGTATVNSTDGSARLIVNLPIRGGNASEPGMVSMELYVLKTDYISYSLAYSCVNLNPFQRAVGVWKLSRTRTLTDTANSEINTYMNTRQELYQPYFETVKQSDNCEEPSSSYIVRSSIIIILICSFLHLLY